jgi:hypothetical protein
VRASNIFRVLSIDNVRGSEDVVGPRRGGGELLSSGSTGVEAGTVAAACMLTRSTPSSEMADAFAWSASMFLCVGEKKTFEGCSPCLLNS